MKRSSDGGIISLTSAGLSRPLAELHPMASENEIDNDPTASALMTLIGDRVLQVASDFTPQSDLFSAGLDSIAIMQLLLSIEDVFGIQIPLESVSRKNFQTVSAVAQLVNARLPANGAHRSSFESARAISPNGSTVETPPPDRPAPAPAPARPQSRLPGACADFRSAPLRHCDYFVLSFDVMSRKTGQGGHKAQSVLMLDRLPDVGKLRDLLQAATNQFPMLSAKVHRRWLIGAPEWRPAPNPAVPELKLYSERQSPGRLLKEGAELCDDVPALLNDIFNTPMPTATADALSKARFSLIETRDGGATLVFSWSHLMCDGVGAELFLQELERISSGSKEAPLPAMPEPSGVQVTLKERLKRAKPIIRHFRTLVSRKFDCLGPRKPTAGRTHFEMHTLTVEQTRAANARCEAFGAGLVNMPFYLACVMRAHEKVFARRGLCPPSHVCTVPVQTRRKGSRGPVFQNHVTMFFASLLREELASLETAVASLMAQHTQFLKDGLGDALNDLMHTMRLLPPSLYMAFISRQMRGPFASFFHSHTGEFAAGMDSFLGSRIMNAYHVPGIATPPGTGIFCNEKNGRLVVTLCWHEKSMDEAERRLLLESFLEDLGAK